MALPRAARCRTTASASRSSSRRRFSSPSSAQRREHGTGLGLATCYGLVKAAGGAIQLDSVPGQGTTFRIFLPESEVAGELAGPPPADPALPSGRRETLLLIDDDPAILSLLARALTRSGYRVVTAASAAQAVLVTREHERTVGFLYRSRPGGAGDLPARESGGRLRLAG
ncbi:MAG: hypothetical protein HY319_18180 [Armatimonadetes bacterium]|nr:hypothetical protein [Armatimonadota bacterium]